MATVQMDSQLQRNLPTKPAESIDPANLYSSPTDLYSSPPDSIDPDDLQTPDQESKEIKEIRKYDWEAIELEFLSTPDMTYEECADLYEMPYSTLYARAGPQSGDWIGKRRAKLRQAITEQHQRMAEVLATNRGDEIQAFKAIQERLQHVVLSGIELLFPPTDAPVEVHLAAQKRLAGMSGKQLSSLVAEGIRALTEAGRHVRLLTGQSTAIFERAGLPEGDVLIPLDIEEARALENRLRLAQSALQAQAEGMSLDVEYALLPPDSAGKPVPVGVSPGTVSPIPPAVNSPSEDVGI